MNMGNSNSYITLNPLGDLDANSSVELDEQLSRLISDGHRRIHVDFSGINYVASAGMGVFVAHLDEIQVSGGQIVLSQMKENVFDAFQLLGLDQLIPIVGNEQEAEKLFNE